MGDNFDLLAIPTNQFGLQEPGNNDDIPKGLEHVRPGDGFIPNYRVAGKTECNGLGEEPLFAFLKDLCPGTTNVIGSTEDFYWTPTKQTDLTWNFEKFLINAEGKPIRRYNPSTSPFTMRDDIQELLDELEASKEAEAAKKHESVRKMKVLKGMANRVHKPRP